MKLFLDTLKMDQIDLLDTLNLTTFEIECSSRAMSNITGDNLPEAVDLKSFIHNYLLGEKICAEINPMDIDKNYWSIKDHIDFNFRYDLGGIEELYDSLKISDIVNSKRLYSIAKKLKLISVLDLFSEQKSRQWMDETLVSNYTISPDQSAKKIGPNYYIHEGTNNWNKVWLRNIWDHTWQKQLLVWQDQLYKTEKKAREISSSDYAIVVIPEKDTIARFVTSDFINSGLLPMLFMQNVAKKIDQNKFHFPLRQLIEIASSNSFSYPDSHLSPMFYWEIFKGIIDQWGLASHINKFTPLEELRSGGGDLTSKFLNYDTDGMMFEFKTPNASLSQIYGGSKEFKSPLASSHVSLLNESAIIKGSVLILGDSHSSLGGSPYLTSIFSHFFREVSFYWNPCNLSHIELDKLNYDYCLCEISQRFIFPNFHN